MIFNDPSSSSYNEIIAQSTRSDSSYMIERRPGTKTMIRCASRIDVHKKERKKEKREIRCAMLTLRPHRSPVQRYRTERATPFFERFPGRATHSKEHGLTVHQSSRVTPTRKTLYRRFFPGITLSVDDRCCVIRI